MELLLVLLSLLFIIDITLFLDIIILLEVRLDPLLSRVLEFIMLSVSFIVPEIRSFILDFKFLVKLVVSLAMFNSIADTLTNVVKMAIMLNVIMMAVG